jgi:cytochrome c oxidase subunit 2
MLVTIALVVAAATTAIAVLVDWLPDAASEERERIDLVFWVTTFICVGVFAVVAAVAIYAGVKFRARPDDDSDGAPIHGHTGLEIAWTAVPTVLVIIIGVLSAVVLARNDRAGSNPNEVAVLGQQFTWRFEHANGVDSPNLYLPVNRPTLLRLRARDVIHSFWVREFGQKQDAVPGIETKLVITPNRVGEYTVICTELCGLGHSVMRSRAIVLSQGDYERWFESRGETGETGETQTTEARG